MSAPALGEAATQLPWLFPGASTLAALARAAPTAAWDEVRLDPGGILLVFRTADRSASPALPPFLLRPDLLDSAVRITDLRGPGFVDWNLPETCPVYRTALAYATTACAVAERIGYANPEAAWSAALLAPLGWMALCAVAPAQVKACLESPDFAAAPSETQQRLWGMDQASIGRRLCRRWGLPAWLSAVIGHLDLAVEHAQALGADAGLFRVVQLAVGIVEGHKPLRLSAGLSPEENAAALGIDSEILQALQRDAAGSLNGAGQPSRTWQSPAAMPLLRDLLLLAAEKRRVGETPSLVRLESDIDHLHHALCEQGRTESKRLRELKLASLAEFAAGAGHEINNPLAVISGQAQYLLGHESDPARQKSLQTIVAQTKRIHQILSELMLFSRPPKAKRQAVNIAALTHEVVDSLSDLAAERRVTLCYTPPAQPLTLFVDSKQIHTAILCLLRNAVEAAPTDGWASVRVETPDAGRVDWIVEDNGTGPSSAQVEHLFDPFYSGRHAGRGRGLGLPTAWQMARNHGGDVVYAGTPAGHTRFVLTLPPESLPPARPEAPSPSELAIAEAPQATPMNGQFALRLEHS